MRLLIDECLPRKIKSLLAEGGHVCTTVTEAGFSGKENGELLGLAEGQFDVLVTVDKSIPHQQNIAEQPGGHSPAYLTGFGGPKYAEAGRNRRGRSFLNRGAPSTLCYICLLES